MQRPTANDLDGAEHRHTINTAGTAARQAHRKTKMSTDNGAASPGKFAANCPPLVDWRRRLTGRGFQGLPTHTM